MRVILIALIALVFLFYFAILYVWSSFSYEIDKDSLRMKWTILKYIPLSLKNVRIDDIREIRRLDTKRDLSFGSAIFGNLFTKRGFVLALKDSSWRFLYAKRIWITPENPEEFLAEITKWTEASVTSSL